MEKKEKENPYGKSGKIVRLRGKGGGLDRRGGGLSGTSKYVYKNPGTEGTKGILAAGWGKTSWAGQTRW